MKSSITWFNIILCLAAPAFCLSAFETNEYPPATTYTITREGYFVVYDPCKKIPIYAYERITSDCLEGHVSDKNINFKQDTAIPRIFRSTVKDYQGSGFDKGHMACLANHYDSLEAMESTFLLSNACPQDPGFNRGYWAQFERHVRNLTKEFKWVEIYTGPLFVPHEDEFGNRVVCYRVIGENDVAVPTHFFKVLFLEDVEGLIKTKAYILPNNPISADISLDEFAVTLEKVHKVSGILFNDQN